jgi:hypothetical protein
MVVADLCIFTFMSLRLRPLTVCGPPSGHFTIEEPLAAAANGALGLFGFMVGVLPRRTLSSPGNREVHRSVRRDGPRPPWGTGGWLKLSRRDEVCLGDVLQNARVHG